MCWTRMIISHYTNIYCHDACLVLGMGNTLIATLNTAINNSVTIHKHNQDKACRVPN